MAAFSWISKTLGSGVWEMVDGERDQGLRLDSDRVGGAISERERRLLGVQIKMGEKCTNKARLDGCACKQRLQML